MANRVIRDWTTSEKVDTLSVKAEVFFTRLIMKADDYGNYTGNPKLILAALFPLKQYEVIEVCKWIEECEKVGLIIRYENAGKKYIHIPEFDQKLRRMKSVYPLPNVDGSLRTSDGQVTDNSGQMTAETKRKETETEDETETEGICDLKDLDAELVKIAADLTEGICKFFSVKTVVLSPRYNKVCDFVSTVANKNRINEAVNIFEAYKTYKARSNEALHGVETWIGTKQNHYEDGHWTMTDWIEKEKNYKNERTKGISGPSSPEAGKDYRAAGGF